MKIIFVIAVGGALGAVARYAVMVGAGQWAGFASLYGTMAVNIWDLSYWGHYWK